MRPLATRPGTLIQRAELPTNPPSFTSAPRRLPSLSTAVFCLIGLVSGGFGGLLGIGGGSAIAPLLLIFASLRPSQVSGTTLATVLVISAVGSGTYASLGHLNFGVAWPIAVGSIIGSVSGALASGRLSLRIMVLMFMVILPYFAVKELWPSFAAPIIAPHLIALGALGLGTTILLAGMKHGNLRFSRSLVQVNFTLMALALVTIGLPTVLLATSPEKATSALLFLTPTLSAMLLGVYGLTVFFSLRTQPEETVEGGPTWGRGKALLVLGASTGGMIFTSKLLVGSILPFVETTGISQVFIGLILIPIFGNVVDHIVAITVALKNKMDLSLAISVGSAAQVACLVLPVVVLMSFATGQTMGLVFTPIELIALALGLLLMVPVLLDGQSNWLEGMQEVPSKSV